MNRLEAVQTRLAETLMRDSAPEALKALLPAVSDGLRIAAHIGVAIYRNNTKAVRIRSLEQVYPVCRAILGDTCFRAHARDFIDSHDSTDPDLNHYGQGFADSLASYLAEHGDPRYVGFDYLPDLARLEFRYHELQYVGDDAPFDAATFAEQARNRADRLFLYGSVKLRLLRSNWPVLAIWRAHRQGSISPTLAGDTDYLVLWRERLDVRVERIDADAFELLASLINGMSLAELSTMPGATRLGDYLACGWIAGGRSG